MPEKKVFCPTEKKNKEKMPMNQKGNLQLTFKHEKEKRSCQEKERTEKVRSLFQRIV